MTDTEERLENTDVWPSILSAINAGKAPTEVAAEHGVSASAINGGLRRTGGGGRRRIVRKAAQPTEVEDAPPAEAVPEPPKRSKPTPGLQRVAEHHDLVGAVPDAVVAERAGVSLGTVRNYRKAHGIPGAPRSAWKSATRPAAATKPTKKARRSPTRQPKARPIRKAKPTPGQEKVREHHDLVGASPDHVVAELAGVSVGTVRNYRKAHGIPGAPRSAWANASTRQAPKVQAPDQTTLHAWKVRFESGDERIAVGESLVVVAECAGRANLGGVTSMERLGVVLGGMASG